MQIHRLWLANFRSYLETEVTFPPGLTVVLGPNGSGKTNLLEAIGYLATLRSFRGAPNDALLRLDCQQAVVRADITHGDRALLIETELVSVGRSRSLVNKQPVRRTSDLREALRVTVFSPDDLAIIKGGPGERRDLIDQLVAALHPRHDALQSDLERILRQRNAVLKQAAGRLTSDIDFTLDVWDAKFAEVGSHVAELRLALLRDLSGPLTSAYTAMSGRPQTRVSASYQSNWVDRGLASALREARNDDIRRGVSTVGPQRDDIVLAIDGRPSRTHASQGEQRSLALALRLAGHRHLTERIGSPPVLLLDDVFSELDEARSAALLHNLPVGQAILATAGSVPPAATIESRLSVEDSPTGSRIGDSVDKAVESVDESALWSSL